MIKSKRTIGTICLGLVMICCSFLFLNNEPVYANNTSDVSYKKKILSVVYDNSSSMLGDKDYLARYSLQIMTTLLNSNDELYICPMNAKSDFQINLTSGNRKAEIEDKVINNKELEPKGGTPGNSVDRAISVLESKGMKKDYSQTSMESAVEYWLVILTDGEFDVISSDEKDKPKAMNDFIAERINGYNHLSTIFISFGSIGTIDMTRGDLSLNKDYAFSSYYVPKEEEIIGTMESVSNKISGKFNVTKDSADYYSINKNVVTFDLGKFDFAINSVAIVAQNCDATLESATYKGRSLSTVQYSVLNTCKLNGIREGYSAVLQDTEFMQGDKITFSFSNNISDVTILIEPVLELEPYFEYYNGSKWEPADMQSISSNLKTGDKIKVKYNVISAIDRKKVDVVKIFGLPEEKVVYCSKGYGIGDEIPLSKGNHSIDVSVSMLEGLYVMHSSVSCYIEDNPTYYRCEAKVTQGSQSKYKTGEILYTVYVQNSKLTKDEMADYEYETSLTAPNGEEVPIFIKMLDDGSVYCSFDAENFGFGEYKASFKVTSKTNGISRSVDKRFNIVPNAIEIKCLDTSEIISTVYQFATNKKSIKFSGTIDGESFSFDDEDIQYSLTVDGEKVVDGIKINDDILEFTPNSEILGGNVIVGQKNITLNVSFLGLVQGTCSAKIIINPTNILLKTVESNTTEFDRYDIDKTNASVYFALYHDDIPFTKEELQQVLEDNAFNINTNPAGWITLLPCDVDICISETNGINVIACVVKRDMIKPFASLFGSFIFDNEETITATYYGNEASGILTITPVSMFSRIWRWIVIVLIILFIVHVILFLIGFKRASRLPTGIVLKISLGQRDIDFSNRAVNTKKSEIILYHLKRFIPFMEFYSQPRRKIFGAEFGYSKSGQLSFKFREDTVEAKISDDDSEEYKKLKEYFKTLKKYDSSKRMPSKPEKIRTSIMLGLIDEKDTVDEMGKDVRATTWHVFHNKKGKPTSLIKFISH